MKKNAPVLDATWVACAVRRRRAAQGAFPVLDDAEAAVRERWADRAAVVVAVVVVTLVALALLWIS